MQVILLKISFSSRVFCTFYVIANQSHRLLFGGMHRDDEREFDKPLSNIQDLRM